MKHKEFAIRPFLGLDFTSRKTYRFHLSLKAVVIKQLNDEIAALKNQLKEKEQIIALSEEHVSDVIAKTEVATATLKEAAKKLESENRRQYKAYKALAERQEAIENELNEVLDAKKALEVEYSLVVDQKARLERKLAKFDRPRKKGRFSKRHAEQMAEEIIAEQDAIEGDEALDAEDSEIVDAVVEVLEVADIVSE